MGDLSSSLGQAPARMSIGNLITGQTLEVQYNPTELAEEVASNYAHQAIVGMGHEQLQYINTKNHHVSFELAFDALAQTGASRTQRGDSSPRYDIMAARRFLHSLCYAPRGAGDIRGGSPPRVLFVWPNLFSLQCQVLPVKIKLTRFALNGTPTAYTATVEIEEIRDVRLTMEDVLANGTQRSGIGGDTDTSGGAG